jgi:hypothetical protein
MMATVFWTLEAAQRTFAFEVSLELCRTRAANQFARARGWNTRKLVE